MLNTLKQKLYINTGLDRLGYMMRFVGRHAPLYATGVLASCSYGLLTDIFTGQLYQVVTDWDGGAEHFAAGLLRVFILLASVVLVTGIGSIFFQRAAAAADRDVRCALVRALCRMPMADWNVRHSGDWLTILGRDADNAMEVYREYVTRLFGSVISGVGGFCLLVSYSVPMALFAAGSGFLYLWIGLTQARAMKKAYTHMRESSAKVAEEVSNLSAGAWPVRFYNICNLILSRHKFHIGETYRHTRGIAKVEMRSGALSALGFTLSYSGTLITGLLLVNSGVLSLPQMMALWPVAVGVSLGMSSIGFFVTDFQPAVTAVDRIRQALELPQEEGGSLTTPPEKDPAVELQGVSFSYNGEDEVLKNIDLRIRAGERVAFVGGSGSGKTTLMKLMMRMYDPDEGEIRVFGAPASQYDLTALRAQFSYVPQSAHLIAGSIRENLLLVREDADADLIRQAARQANAHGFIENLPDGYGTDAGEHGARLSGGQRQRIAIARAFLRDAPILIFDEVTASLDGESEEAISQALQNIGDGKTLLLITHRLSTALIAERIVVMDEGRIVETGTHEGLLQARGAYYKLWQMQTEA